MISHMSCYAFINTVTKPNQLIIVLQHLGMEPKYLSVWRSCKTQVISMQMYKESNKIITLAPFHHHMVTNQHGPLATSVTMLAT